MATSKKQVIEVTGDAVNATVLKAFAGIVKGSLEGERKAWLEGVSLMARGIVTQKGMQETIKANIEENGSLPTLSVSSVQYWGRMKALEDLEGGSTFTLKELEKLARDLSALESFKGAKFLEGIKGKKVSALRKATPNHNATRAASTAKDTKVTDKKGTPSQEEVAKKLLKAILDGKATISLETASALWDALADYVAGGEEEAA